LPIRVRNFFTVFTRTCPYLKAHESSPNSECNSLWPILTLSLTNKWLLTFKNLVDSFVSISRLYILFESWFHFDTAPVMKLSVIWSYKCDISETFLHLSVVQIRARILIHLSCSIRFRLFAVKNKVQSWIWFKTVPFNITLVLIWNMILCKLMFTVFVLITRNL
jgi:hypothetical protein